MQKKILLLLSLSAFCLLSLSPIWDTHFSASSQDKVGTAEVTAALQVQQQAAANLTRSETAQQKFEELSAKAQVDDWVPVIVKLRVAFRPEGDMLLTAEREAQRVAITQSRDQLMNGLSGYDPASLKSFEFVPYVALRVNAAGLEALRLAPDVLDIDEDVAFPHALAESVPLVGAPEAWAAGFTGAGQVVAVLDTGVDKTHPFLSGKVVSEACYSSNDPTFNTTSLCPGGVTESIEVDSGLNCSGVSGCEHGTHVSGIAAGRGASFSGVAKDADLIAIQIFSRFNTCGPCLRAFTSDIMKGLERVYSLRDSYKIASVNMSLGGGLFTTNCDGDPLKGIIDNLRSVGIATVVASGNNGIPNALSSPACISSAISVGATGDGSGGFGADLIASFSNSAPFLSLLAPGVSINSSIPGGGFANFNGTSMATPHVAGAWAVMKQQYPTASVSDVLNELAGSGRKITDPRNGISFPRLNLNRAAPCVAVAEVPAERWKGEYFDNPNLEGSPAMLRDDGDGFINYNWSAGRPDLDCGLGADEFSVRWTRTVNFTPGIYRFTATADDGVRVFIDGVLKIDAWVTQPATSYTVDMEFTAAGNHEIKMEYFERSGEATARLSWRGIFGGPGCVQSVPPEAWKAEFFNNTNLTGNPYVVRNYGFGTISLNPGLGSPDPCASVVDNFSARFTRTVNFFTPGLYRFTARADDGVRLYIDGVLKIDAWVIQPPTDYTVQVNLTAGNHELKLEYFEKEGGSTMILDWGLDTCRQVVPPGSWKGEYFNNATLTGSPTMVRNDGSSSLFFNVGTGGPGPFFCFTNTDNFSVRWTRTVTFFTAGTYRFTTTADDGVRLYVDGVLKIDAWVDQAPTTYTADVELTADNHEIKVEYYERGGGAQLFLDWIPIAGPVCQNTVPPEAWKGEYFNNETLTGSPVMVRNDGFGSLFFNVGTGGPGPFCFPYVDNFSVRWTRTVNLAAGIYRFTTTADDGVRLYVDGVLKIDAFVVQAPTTYTADVELTAGNHVLKVEYFERGGGAQLFLDWIPIGGAVCQNTVPPGAWKGEYFNSVDLTGSPTMVRNDGFSSSLFFNFGTGGPGPFCFPYVDNFSVRWTRTANFAADTYRFSVTADDGVRLYIDGVLKIDGWEDRTTPGIFTIDEELTAGDHEVKLEYYEKTGNATLLLAWAPVSNCMRNVPIDNWRGEYFNNRTLTGTPSMVRNDGTFFLFPFFGESAPDSVCFPYADNFSVRWTRRVNFGPGNYRFSVFADDGVRFYIDGQLKIDRWFDQSGSQTIDVALTEGFHDLMLEYYENTGTAFVQFSWNPIDTVCMQAVDPVNWRGDYFNNANLEGEPVMRRNYFSFLDLNFGAGSPSPGEQCGVGADFFSARYTRTTGFSAATYRFTITADDGVRLYIDGELKLDAWQAHEQPITYNVDVPLTAANHKIVLEYFENTGNSQVRLFWNFASSP